MSQVLQEKQTKDTLLEKIQEFMDHVQEHTDPQVFEFVQSVLPLLVALSSKSHSSRLPLGLVFELIIRMLKILQEFDSNRFNE